MTDLPFVTFLRGPLVAAVRSFNNEPTPYVPFAYLGGYIAQHGYEFAVVDGVAEGLDNYVDLKDYPGYRGIGLSLEEIVDRIPARTDILAFGAMFSGEWPLTRDLINLARERFPNALIAAGGEHVTALSEYSLRDCPALDVCVRGEGEHTLYELLEAWRETGSYQNVAGIAYLDATGVYKENGGLPRIREIDAIPWPRWPDGYLEKFWKAGKSYGTKTDRDMPMLASRGCPYQCTFCSNPQMWTTRYILRDVDDLIAEIKCYREKYDITGVQFYDLTAITKKRWTVDFCQKLIENDINIAWSLPSGTRSEALDEEVLSLMKQTGCSYLVYAPESGSPETLERIKKRISLEKLTDSLMTAKRLGITTRANIIIGFPHETRKNVFESIRYGLYLAFKGVDEVPINIYSAYPGSELFNQLFDQKLITLNDQYFLGLQSLNSDYTNLHPINYNPYIGIRELALYRISFMILNYIISYLAYPSRIRRSFMNLTSGKAAATVLEHRLIDYLKKRKLTKIRRMMANHSRP